AEDGRNLNQKAELERVEARMKAQPSRLSSRALVQSAIRAQQPFAGPRTHRQFSSRIARSPSAIARLGVRCTVCAVDGAQREGGAMITITVNGRTHEVTADPSTPLLYVLREDLELNGARFGCGVGQCGACMVILEDQPLFSCLTPLASVEGRRVRT